MMQCMSVLPQSCKRRLLGSHLRPRTRSNNHAKTLLDTNKVHYSLPKCIKKDKQSLEYRNQNIKQTLSKCEYLPVAFSYEIEELQTTNQEIKQRQIIDRFKNILINKFNEVR
jgi:hypothetical protein